MKLDGADVRVGGRRVRDRIKGASEAEGELECVLEQAQGLVRLPDVLKRYLDHVLDVLVRCAVICLKVRRAVVYRPSASDRVKRAVESSVGAAVDPATTRLVINGARRHERAL